MGCCVSVPGIDEPLIDQEYVPLSINETCVTKQRMLLKMKSKFSFSGDDRIIREIPSDQPILQVSGKVMSIAQISFMNMSDQLLCKLNMGIFQYQYFCEYPEFTIEDAHRTTVAVIQREWKCMSMLDTFTVVRASDSKVVYFVEGNYYNKRFVIRNELGQIVARTGRKLVQTGIISNSYGLEIAAGVDMVLMACVCSAIDKYAQQENHDQNYNNMEFESNIF